MLFNSLSFLIFFVFVFGAFWLLPTWTRKKHLLLLASLIFYAAWNPPYVVLLIISLGVDWQLARLIGRTLHPSKRRLYLVISLVFNLGMLGYFKYGDFFLQNFFLLCANLGINYHPTSLGIILPIGISFYTFASLSYTVDVYRKEIQPSYKFTDYALFVSFFPHLVAGPIVRASFLLPQIENPKTPTMTQVSWGLTLFFVGLFFKVVMADGIFAPLVNAVYEHPKNAGFISTWIAVFSFSGQIYFDFSGYSLCAIGLAMCFGFWFPINFNCPYGASSFSDFWRRWHISLSSWLRDYLYIPLGGNRYGKWHTYFALFTTMLIGGLWHGASWMFVLWGALHGVYLALERMLKGLSLENKILAQGKSAVIFLIISLTWIFFRAESPETALDIIRGLLNTSKIAAIEFPELLAIISILVMMRWHFLMKNYSIDKVFLKLGVPIQIALLSFVFVALFLCSGGNSNAFIYFQF